MTHGEIKKPFDATVPPRRFEYHPSCGDHGLKQKSRSTATFSAQVPPRRFEYHPSCGDHGLKQKSRSTATFSAQVPPRRFEYHPPVGTAALNKKAAQLRLFLLRCLHGDSNSGLNLERVASWASRRWRHSFLSGRIVSFTCGGVKHFRGFPMERVGRKPARLSTIRCGYFFLPNFFLRMSSRVGWPISCSS